MLIDMPVAFEDFQKGTSSLLDFYAKLGWDCEKQLIGPRKIVLNSEDANEAMTYLMSSGETVEEQAQLGLFWMNQGPSHSPDMPKGKVRLEAGWVEDETK